MQRISRKRTLAGLPIRDAKQGPNRMLECVLGNVLITRLVVRAVVGRQLTSKVAKLVNNKARKLNDLGQAAFCGKQTDILISGFVRF
jgi:hypothetical protein